MITSLLLLATFSWAAAPPLPTARPPLETVKSKSGVIWNLLLRSVDTEDQKTYEVWRDTTSGLLWSGRISFLKPHTEAVKYDAKGKVVKEVACNSDKALRARKGITGGKFRLPTIDELVAADQHGIAEAIPNLVDPPTLGLSSSTLCEGNPAFAAAYWHSDDKVVPCMTRESHLDNMWCVSR